MGENETKKEDSQRTGHKRPNPGTYNNAFLKLLCISKSGELIQSALKRSNMQHLILELLPSFFISKMPSIIKNSAIIIASWGSRELHIKKIDLDFTHFKAKINYNI